jgi:hypothetical protein
MKNQNFRICQELHNVLVKSTQCNIYVYMLIYVVLPSLSALVAVDNIKVYLEVTGCEDVDWIHLALDRVRRRAIMNTILNLWVS